MQYLTMPATSAEDDKVITKLGKDPLWNPIQAAWLAAYANYRSAKGDPFSVAPHKFGAGYSDRQYALYDTRKSGGPIKRIRDRDKLLSCPVCGSGTTASLDHYLPRTAYPEFAIMRANLVNACPHCNSSEKGSKVHGDPGERFIHPYYDTWAANDLWFINILPPFAAARFEPTAIATLPPAQHKIVTFHLRYVLGEQFQRSTRDFWSVYPDALREKGAGASKSAFLAALNLDYRVARVTERHNGWQTAFYRGMLGNVPAQDYVWSLL